MTPTGRLSRRVPEAEACFVEQRLIHDATTANPDLKNSHNTRFVNNLEIPGVLNSPQGQPGEAVKGLNLLGRCQIVVHQTTRDHTLARRGLQYSLEVLANVFSQTYWHGIRNLRVLGQVSVEDAARRIARAA